MEKKKKTKMKMKTGKPEETCNEKSKNTPKIRR